ncbi:class I SAM-dependent methyltransferase [Actinomadura sp. HBU206391]|uniref:class I SAM-dependent methyltransferase n=1 Tax=Actinomadura sp. HBU206391 TaxID=2731692 RepID=UPI00164F8E37|nr:class I SAM-dependent methyltransferase [Actinomadura sp. HBU206391]MBC6459940.1 methyltransferase domain-containing protein [Actinomadura sp. HBU206391]
MVDRRLSFGASAELYDRVRPGYPAAAVEWALRPLGTGRWRVVDLGAGTGLLTRVAIDAGHEVVPVEPDPRMRDRLITTLGVAAAPGRAEDIPLPGTSADAVVAGTAFHWFEADRALPEIARVLRPGGVFAALTHGPTGDDWTVQYFRLLHGWKAVREHTPLSFGPLFTEVETTAFPYTITQTPEGLADLASSYSYFITATPEERRRILDELDMLRRGHPELAGRETFEMPYTVHVARAVRRSA